MSVSLRVGFRVPHVMVKAEHGFKAWDEEITSHLFLIIPDNVEGMKQLLRVLTKSPHLFMTSKISLNYTTHFHDSSKRHIFKSTASRLLQDKAA
jgi:hypothetical protein